MVVCLQKTKKKRTKSPPEQARKFRRTMSLPLVCKYSCCTHFSLPILPSIGGPGYKAAVESPTYIGGQTSFNVNGDSCWIFQDLDQTWKVQIMHFIIFGRNALLYQPFSVPAGDSLDTEIEQAYTFQKGLVIWSTSPGWAWANGFTWLTYCALISYLLSAQRW